MGKILAPIMICLGTMERRKDHLESLIRASEPLMFGHQDVWLATWRSHSKLAGTFML
jgi:hypothetical protein